MIRIAICCLVVMFWSYTAAAQTQPKQQNPEDIVKASIDRLVSCMYARADALAAGAGKPIEIAEAVLGECGVEHSAYRTATADYFVSRVSRRGETAARARAKEDVAEFTRDVQRMVVSRVVRARDLMATTQASAHAFSDCAFDAAEAQVADDAAPDDVADRAIEKCLPQYEAFRSALRTPPHVQNNPAALARADAFAVSTRQGIRSDIVRVVIAARTATK